MSELKDILSGVAAFQHPILGRSLGQLATSLGGFFLTCAAMYLCLGISLWVSLPLSVLAAGFLELSFNAMAQSLVQINAPPDMRGRVIGLFNMASLGLRAFSGISVGVLGSLIGIHWSLALSALAAMIVAGGLLAVQ